MTKPLTPTQQGLVDQGNRAVRRRQRWERSAPGQERMETAQSAYGTQMTTGQIYAARGWGEQGQAETGHPRAYDRQIPGMEDPHAAAVPAKWEDMHPDKQADVQRRVKAKSGATFDSMSRSFGAQLDHAYMRADAEQKPDIHTGTPAPAGQDFYTSGEPRQVIQRTAMHHGVPQQLVAAMHADNSPNTSFQRPGKNGEKVYPQDVMTRSALSQIQEGTLPSQVQRPPRAEGYTTNFEKSAKRASQVLHEGKPVGEAGAKSGFGPKTAAYMNSWLPSQPDFFVSDVHSGGSMVPHQSTEKLARTDEHGAPIMQTVNRSDSAGGTVDVPRRHKSEREKTIETQGFHQMADYAARQAISARGLGSVRQAQAAQWNEERVRRFGSDRSYAPDSDTDKRAHREIPGQGKLL